MIHYVQILNRVRRQHKTFNHPPKWIHFEEGTVAFTKGQDILVVLANNQASVYHQIIEIRDHPFQVGNRFCNVFADWICVKVDDNRSLRITLVGGYPLLFIREPQPQPTSLVLRLALGGSFLLLLLAAAYLLWPSTHTKI